MSTVEGNYTLEILMLSYENPSHMAKSLENFRLGCCELDTTTPCRPCDNAFRVCVRNIPTIEGDCDLNQQDSTLIAEDDDDLMFTIGDDIGGLSNPILGDVGMWSNCQRGRSLPFAACSYLKSMLGQICMVWQAQQFHSFIIPPPLCLLV